jgi:hypothetical protein
MDSQEGESMNSGFSAVNSSGMLPIGQQYNALILFTFD